MKAPMLPGSVIKVDPKSHLLTGFTFEEPKTKYEKGDKIGPFVSKLLPMEGQLHRFHLKTKSHARHITLDEAYKGLPEKIDALAEAYLSNRDNQLFALEPVEVDMAEDLLQIIIDEGNAIKVDCRCTNNALDDLVSFATSILYKIHMH